MNACKTTAHSGLTCQSFRRGCVGCCVNMRWSDRRITRFLRRNTDAVRRLWPAGKRPGFGDLVRLHWARTGLMDHLLGFWLVMPTMGLSAWVWKRFQGSCPFVGFLDETTGRSGCLVHPLRVGAGLDCRRHAFPLMLTVGCDRELRCGMLDDNRLPSEAGLLEASRKGGGSIRRNRLQQIGQQLCAFVGRLFGGRRTVSLAACDRGDVLLEYVIITTLIILPLVAAGNMLFNPSGIDPVTGRRNLGMLGEAFVGLYQRVVCGIGLPVP